ncbi:hypothetical protein COO59_10330 [Mixta theicola]|uniref:Uncharacterized protein n=1 Tax=Mixta theicola TaxID=1458355 RepID=A0A2K1QA06_9GAMM|nr:hypothetical protein [Mixta theicola]PNS11873.1 hypothetical protein COO59_10330 [Mixta theicola]GLR07803.1 hypothetical protein GCM10007905_05220 [Mixta theicola]
MKKLLLVILSRLVQGVGIGICGLTLLCAGWFLFFSYSDYRYFLSAFSLLGLVVGYHIFKFAVLKIYDESPGDW